MKLFILAVLVAGIAIALEFFRGSEKSQSKYQYKKKDFFMTRPEHELYDILVSIVGDKYYIYPQAHLPAVVDYKVVGQNWKAAFSHINQKSVDFVLCDKKYISPKLAIELDDKSHEREYRIERDIEVERILAESQLPLLRIKNNGSFDPKEILQRINELVK